MSFTLATIVEGHGEVQAFPVLLRRLRPLWTIATPVRGSRQALVDCNHPKRLEHYLPIARSNIQRDGAILILLDADDDCPAQLAPTLIERSRTVIHDMPISVVFPKRCFESWFIGGKSVEIDYNGDVDDLRSPKASVKRTLGRYKETVDMPKLAARIDTEAALECSSSFQKLLRDLDSISPGESR